MEEFLEGYQIFWFRFIEVANILAKLQNIEWAVKCLEWAVKCLECVSDSNKNHLFYNGSYICYCYVHQAEKKSLEIVGDDSL